MRSFQTFATKAISYVRGRRAFATAPFTPNILLMGENVTQGGTLVVRVRWVVASRGSSGRTAGLGHYSVLPWLPKDTSNN